MITGGSQGARSVNDFIAAFAQSPSGRDALRAGHWQILHQTGKDADASARAAYVSAGLDAIVHTFSDQMGDWWSAASEGGLAIARSGAGNVAEAWATTTPTLFLPYPFHKDDHQKHNARVIVESGGVLLCTDHISPESNMNAHAAALAGLLADPARRASMRAALTALGPANGAERIAQALWESAQSRK
jgi:UDP-N-acetylglucosamine--N-acetylmuramyl-(pentapeptide) pyrophosphoryl-undecaprenol N-acetylglucosamine transferase